MEIITNNKPRNMLYGYELTEKQKAEFDYITHEIEAHDFVKYKGHIYDLSEFMRIDDATGKTLFKGWQGYISDSAFSGVLIKIVDSDTVIMGQYFS